MIKRSAQRELIRQNLITRCDHPTADMVYQSVRAELPNVSLGTVYRNLRFLVENGEALSLNLGDGKEHFDGKTFEHQHFICSECGEVEDLEINLPDISSAVADFSGQICGHKIYFYGKCSNCLNK